MIAARCGRESARWRCGWNSRPVRCLSNGSVDWETVWAGDAPSFHRDGVSPSLVKFLDTTLLPEIAAKGKLGSMRAFVPLCGQTVDVPYLAARGFHVIGLECSQGACRRAAASWKLASTPAHVSDGIKLVGSLAEPENPVVDSAREDGSRGSMALLHGDVVSLPPELLEKSDLVWDRAGVTSVTGNSLARSAMGVSVGDRELVPSSRLERVCRLDSDSHAKDVIAAYYGIMGEMAVDGGRLLVETMATQSSSGDVVAGVGLKDLIDGLEQTGWRDCTLLAEANVTADYPTAQLAPGQSLVEIHVTATWERRD